MKFKRIRSRMLAFILPVIIISYAVIMVISIVQARSIITSQLNDTMNTELRAIDGEIGEYINSVGDMCQSIATLVEATYQTTDWDTYEAALGKIISNDDMVLGTGLWFEPNAYDETQKYYGPYIYKDGSDLVTTWDYSNADYDYFSQEYYTNAMAADGVVFTNPYYDETSGMIMSSSSCPIIVNGKAIGCVTVDIEITSIQKVTDSIKVGKTGHGILIASDGTLIGGVDDETIAAATNIADYSELKSIASNVTKNASGQTSYTKGKNQYNVYYDTIDETGWKLLIIMSEAELSSAMKSLKNQLFAVTVVTLLIVVFAIIKQVNVITRGIVKVQKFSSELSEGDFTIEEIKTKETDEIGTMSAALNNMFNKNRSVISNIAGRATEIDASSQRLSSAASKLTEQFDSIQNYMHEVNDAMAGTSAATEEVNASAEEVFSNVNLLAEEAENCKALAESIQDKAKTIEKESQDSSESAISLGQKFESQLKVSIENSAVVENIGEMANVISSIADQINLLSLNASIEAARAGEAGRGFAVVASEIGGLAGETASAVKSIQETIEDVHKAFADLTKNANELLAFLQETVTPDYDSFVDIAKQYGEDAQSFYDASTNIANMSENIRMIMQEVTDAIQSVAESTTDTTYTSSKVTDAVEEVSTDVETISSMSTEQEEIALDLNNIVSTFKL